MIRAIRLASLSEISLEEIKSLKHQRIEHDCRGEKLKNHLDYLIVISKDEILFGGSCSKSVHSKHIDKNLKGKFQPELWKEDCLELFLSLDDSSKYYEFNLSPTGAWWAKTFTNHREGDTNCELSKIDISIFNEVKKDFFYSYLRFNLKEFLGPKNLHKLAELENLKVNFSAILFWKKQEGIFENYISAAHDLNPLLKNEKIDFHLKDLRLITVI